MPEIDGFKITYVKGINLFKNIPIIFITAIYDKNEYKSKGYELGAIDYITENLSFQTFIFKLY